MAALNLSQFSALSESARVSWFYTATATEIASLRALCLADASRNSTSLAMLADADTGARAQLAREIKAAQLALEDSMQRAYAAAKVA